MADPIVFDCGGSTRIKQILTTGAGDMPRLLNVHDLTNAAGSAVQVLPGTPPSVVGVLGMSAQGSQEEITPTFPGAPFANMLIMFQDAAGNPFTIQPALPNSFEIVSHSSQKVRGHFIPNPNPANPNPVLLITVYSNLTDPIVAAKQNRTDTAKRLRCRYVIDNAGPIKTITLNHTTPPGVVVYNASNTEAPANPITVPAAIGAGAAPGLPLYVSVVVF